MPRHEFIKTSNLVICDAAENIGEPSLRIDAVELGCFDQCAEPAERLLYPQLRAY